MRMGRVGGLLVDGTAEEHLRHGDPCRYLCLCGSPPVASVTRRRARQRINPANEYT